jgi:hypothetical protein
VLRETQAAFTHVCFTKEPRERDLETLGARRDRWLLYRDMVRGRFARMIESGIPKSVEAMGADRFAGAFSRWLDESPPKSRYIREVVSEFVAFALPRVEGEPPWLTDLLRYEIARWEVGFADVALPTDAGEFAFDKIAIANPTLRLLPVSFRVDQKPDDGGYRAERKVIAIFRKPNDRVATWSLGERGAAWLAALARSDRSVTDVVKAVAAERGEAIDAAYVESLGGTLAKFLDASILLGARDPA